MPKKGLPVLSPYKAHVEKWTGCEDCHLSRRRHRMAFVRGTVPCDVLFLGEAPGASEDVLGRPFVGPAGKLLDQIIARAVPEGVTYAMTNLVCCIPLDEDGSKTTEPDHDAVMACAPRLVEFVTIAKPRLIVMVGACADKYVVLEGEGGYRNSVKLPGKMKRARIDHPAAILRANVAQRGLMIQRASVVISTAIDDMMGES